MSMREPAMPCFKLAELFWIWFEQFELFNLMSQKGLTLFALLKSGFTIVQSSLKLLRFSRDLAELFDVIKNARIAVEEEPLHLAS